MDKFELRNDSKAWTLCAAGGTTGILTSRKREDAIQMSCEYLRGLAGPSDLRVLGDNGRIDEEYVFPRCDALISWSRR